MPGGRWGAPWLLALVLAFTVLAALEVFVRWKGFTPSVTDDKYLWALERARVSNGNDNGDQARNTLAVIGTSRIALAWSAHAARAKLPDWTIAMLALEGTAPIGALRDLAADEGFRGVALVDVAEPHFSKRTWRSQQSVIRAYHRRWLDPGAIAERWLATRLQARFAVLRAGGRATLEVLLFSRRWRDVPAVTTFADRTRVVHYTPEQFAKVRARRVKKIKTKKQANAEAWLKNVAELDASVRAIRARGGDVVFVRMPSTDERWIADEKHMPKALFWDRLPEVTDAILVHFRDEPGLASFPCPDTSHIDSQDAPAFTSALLDVLAARGVLGDRDGDRGPP